MMIPLYIVTSLLGLSLLKKDALPNATPASWGGPRIRHGGIKAQSSLTPTQDSSDGSALL